MRNKLKLLIYNTLNKYELEHASSTEIFEFIELDGRYTNYIYNIPYQDIEEAAIALSSIGLIQSHKDTDYNNIGEFSYYENPASLAWITLAIVKQFKKAFPHMIIKEINKNNYYDFNTLKSSPTKAINGSLKRLRAAGMLYSEVVNTPSTYRGIEIVFVPELLTDIEQKKVNHE
jgi:hypothetical protein